MPVSTVVLLGAIVDSQHGIDSVRRNKNTKVNIREHTAHRLYFKHPSIEFSLVHLAGCLFQQWCVDMAAKIIEQRLLFHRHMNTKQYYRRKRFLGFRICFFEITLDRPLRAV
ncbi:hypothetical protein PHMEG_00014637 [Phytophthora megakarya]|uniref:Uncharacterized protein n=1 Tax=Phytophthora megakarya TaxID=4795 RepID=A0A225W3U3_9STRA|nr:hypothetical protein PHMEG_00014637 [Phytophthora megakarya]